MHDLVRDVALWIASKSGQEIFTRTELDPKVLADDEVMKNMKAIALWDFKHDHLLNYKINCPILEILLLSFNVSGGVRVSDGCLQSLEKLKTLAIIESALWNRGALPLQESLKSLKNLRTLCLRGYGLGDISFVERLQALEILDLRFSSFDDLPGGIVKLKKLKLLDLYQCWIQKKENVKAYEVVGKCLQLEELYLHLINYEKAFPYDVSFSRLQRYVIERGYYKSFDDNTLIRRKYAQSRSLSMNRFDVAAQSFISLPIKDLFIRAEFLYLTELEGDYKNIIPSMDPQGMNQLIALKLEDCSKIECLVSTSFGLLQTEVIAFSTLVYLSLEDLHKLREVFCDPSSRCSLKNLEELEIKNCGELYSISFLRNSKLCNLKVLSISKCPMLTSLFSSSVAQTLEVLEDLKISKCSSLRHIIEEDNDVLSSTQSHSSLMLPKLRNLFILECDNLEYIFSVFLVEGLSSLEIVKIFGNQKLKYVFGSEKEHNVAGYPSFQQTNTRTNLFNLNTLRLSFLPNLIAIWPEYCRAHLPSLNDLFCHQCPKLYIHKMMIASDIQQQTTPTEKEIVWLITNTLNQLEADPLSHPQLKVFLKFRRLELSDFRIKGLFQFQMGEQGDTTELVPLHWDINYLTLWCLPELNFIWKGPTALLNLQNLYEIRIVECPKLKTIFSTTVVTSLPRLTYMEIRICDELEHIFHLGDAHQLKSLYSFQQVCFPTLLTILVENCNKLKCLFYNLSATHFTGLRYLDIQECSQLHKVFGFEHESNDGGLDGMGKDEKQVLLQNLKRITLINLPNFEEIHHGFKLKEDVKQTMKKCPVYSPSLYLHPGGT